MPAEASLQELQLVHSTIQSMRAINPAFFAQLFPLLYKAENNKIPFGYICQKVMGVEIHERYINKIRNQSKLSEIHHDLFLLKTEHYESYRYLSNFLNKNCRSGYKNICKLIMGNNPVDLKGGYYG